MTTKRTAAEIKEMEERIAALENENEALKSRPGRTKLTDEERELRKVNGPLARTLADHLFLNHYNDEYLTAINKTRSWFPGLPPITRTKRTNAEEIAYTNHVMGKSIGWTADNPNPWAANNPNGQASEADSENEESVTG